MAENKWGTAAITLLIGSLETTHLGGGLKYLIYLYPDLWGDDPI